jgi:hypothetical protein
MILVSQAKWSSEEAREKHADKKRLGTLQKLVRERQIIRQKLVSLTNLDFPQHTREHAGQFFNLPVEQIAVNLNTWRGVSKLTESCLFLYFLTLPYIIL